MPKNKYSYSGGLSVGGGATSRWTKNAKNTFNNITDFNEAFDAAVNNNLPTFWFNGLEYNTKKENNPVREANNRVVGLTRSVSTRPDKDYIHQAGPFRSPLNAFPIVTDTYQKALEQVPTLEYDDSNPADYIYGYKIDRGSVLKNIFFPSYIERGKPIKKSKRSIENGGK